MKSNLIFLCLLFSTQAFSFDPDFKTVNDRMPLEFQFLFDSLKLEIKTPSEKIRMVGLCKDLDVNLGFLKKEHIHLLMKSEVIKNVLEHQFGQTRSLDINNQLLQRLDEAYAKKETYLTPFSRWIWRSLLADLKHHKNEGFISQNSFNPANFSGAKKTEAYRFNRYLTYILPWIDKMDALTASDFNLLTKEVSWIILKRLNERSLLFKRFASTSAGDTKITLFNIPQKLLELNPEDIKLMQKDETPVSLKDEGLKERVEAGQHLEKITPEDLSPMSDDLARELEKKAQ